MNTLPSLIDSLGTSPLRSNYSLLSPLSSTSATISLSSIFPLPPRYLPTPGLCECLQEDFGLEANERFAVE